MRIVLLFLLTFSTLMTMTHSEAIKLYENNFKKDAILKVKELDGHYVVLSSTINFGIDENRKLNLIAKYLIFEHLKKSDKKITAITLQGFQNAAEWKTEDRLYLLSFVRQEDVTPDYTLIKKIEKVSILDDEITLLEQSKNKDVVIHKQLKNLYFQKGDMDNYNREVNILMNIKFNGQ